MKRKLQGEAEGFKLLYRRTRVCHASTLAAATAAGLSFLSLSFPAAAEITAVMTATTAAAAVAATTIPAANCQ